MKIVVTETFQHFLPNGLGWIEGLQQLGHETFGLQSHLYSINAINEKMDVVVFMGMHTVKLEDVIKFKDRYPNTKLVAVCYGFEEYYLTLKPYIDLWVEHNFKHDLVDNLFKQEGMKLVHIPLGSSINKFKPLDITKDYDVSFIGQFGNAGHGYREQDYYLDPVLNLNLKGIYSGFYNHPHIASDQLNTAYNLSKVNLNFHYPSQKIQTDLQSDSIDFNSRVFDIALSGNFQLCDHPYIGELFEDGVAYTSKEAWIDTLQYYLNNETARLEMANKAYRICLEKHTWKSRMSDFINYINL
jgi:glycosyltransferase involved in cell wall biosynthesis